MRYLLGGVNGSGKTTLLQKIKELRPEFEIIKGSQAFMSFLGIDGDYEALRRLSYAYKLKKLGEMIEKILREYENIIFDAHYLNLVRGEVTSVTGPWIKKFDALILLKVSPAVALKRMTKGPRDRALFPKGLSRAKELSMFRAYILRYENEFQRLADAYSLPAITIDGELPAKKCAQDFLDKNKKILRGR